MTLIGRLFVRGAAATGAIGAAMAIALAPQPGVANTIVLDDHSNGTSVQRLEPAPSAACTAARNAFFAALKADVAEDTSERDLVRTGAATNDPTEDQAEWAGFKPLLSAIATACAPQHRTGTTQPTTTPTAACIAAKSALKSFLTGLRASQQAELTNHTEGTPADQTEDAANWAQLKTLFHNVATACGFTRSFDAR